MTNVNDRLFRQDYPHLSGSISLKSLKASPKKRTDGLLSTQIHPQAPNKKEQKGNLPSLVLLLFFCLCKSLKELSL